MSLKPDRLGRPSVECHGGCGELVPLAEAWVMTKFDAGGEVIQHCQLFVGHHDCLHSSPPRLFRKGESLTFRRSTEAMNNPNQYNRPE